MGLKGSGHCIIFSIPLKLEKNLSFKIIRTRNLCGGNKNFAVHSLLAFLEMFYIKRKLRTVFTYDIIYCRAKQAVFLLSVKCVTTLQLKARQGRGDVSGINRQAFNSSID